MVNIYTKSSDKDQLSVLDERETPQNYGEFIARTLLRI